MEFEIKMIRAEVIHVEDGDVIAVYVNGNSPQDALIDLQEHVRQSFLPKKVNVVVLNADLVEMKVMRAE